MKDIFIIIGVQKHHLMILIRFNNFRKLRQWTKQRLQEKSESLCFVHSDRGSHYKIDAYIKATEKVNRCPCEHQSQCTKSFRFVL